MSTQKFDAEEAEKSANYANAIANDAPKAMTLPKDRMIELADQAATETDHYFVVPRNEVDEWYWLKEYSCRFAALIQNQPAEAQGGHEPYHVPDCLIWPDDERVAQLLDDSSGIWHGNEFRIHADELSRILRELLYRQPTAPEPISWSEEKCDRCEKTVLFRLNVSAAPSLPGSGDD